MNKLNYVKILSLFGLLLLFIGCDSFLDVNENPNEPLSVDESAQLTAIQGYFSYRVIANEPTRVSSLWSQQLAWTGFSPSSDNYDYLPPSTNNFWGPYSYITVMNNAHNLIQQAEESGAREYAGMGKIILAWNLSFITDFFGDAPFSQAFDPSNTTPEYDSQEDIYEAIFELLDDAVDDLQNPGAISPPGRDDMIYGGNLAQWVKLAHTLKARFHMRLTEAPGFDPVTQAQAALESLENGFESNADNAEFQYLELVGQHNPWYQYAIDGKWDTRDQLSENYINLLKSLEDPRLPIQARQVGAVNNLGEVAAFSPEEFTSDMYDQDDSTYLGHVNGEDGGGAAGYSSIGEFYSSSDSPVIWLSYAEAKFLEAEATLLASGATAAHSVYVDAIRASLERLNVGEIAFENYISDRELDLADFLLNDQTAYEHIMTQKYIANFLSSEPYHDWRRTGFPDISPITNNPRTPDDQIPRRFPYPQGEYQNNSENVNATGVPSTYDALSMRVWWDTRL